MDKEKIFKSIFSLVVTFVKFIKKNEIFSKMTTNEFYVYLFISFNQPTTMNNCAKQLNLSKSAITVIVDKLESKNLVIRKRSQKDRRKIYITLTEYGNKIFKDFSNDFSNIIDFVISKIPENDLEIMNKGFINFIKYLGDEEKWFL